MTEHERRAMSAYFRRIGENGQQPSEPQTIDLDGKSYVVLSNVTGILAVYRIKTDGLLKGLRRWPKEIEEAVS